MVTVSSDPTADLVLTVAMANGMATAIDDYSLHPQCEGSDGVDAVTLNAPNLAAAKLESIDLKGGADSLTIDAGPLVQALIA